MARRPIDQGILHDALALVHAGATPDEAAQKMRAMGRKISARTIYRGMPAGGAPVGPGRLGGARTGSGVLGAVVAGLKGQPGAARAVAEQLRQLPAGAGGDVVAPLDLAAALLAQADSDPGARQTPPEGKPIDRLRRYAENDAEALLVLDDLLAEDEAPDGITTLERVRKLIRRVERRALDAKENRFGTLAGVLDRLYARERLLLGPPPAPPDAVLEELRRLDADAIAKIEEHLAEPIAVSEIQ